MLTIAPELPAKVDALSSRMGQSSAALINRGIHEQAEWDGGMAWAPSGIPVG
jgi:hypothetical protein